MLEIVTAVTIMALVLSAAISRFSRWHDRLAVQRSVEEVASFYSHARFSALVRSSRVRIELAPDSMFAAFEGGRDSVFLRRGGPATNGVSFSASRFVIRILPSGIGAGGSNTTLVFRRGMAAESLTTSRLGRLKRWR